MTRATALSTAAISIILTAGAFADQIIYVDAGATGLNDGSSWANAYVHLQDALAQADSLARPVEIHVAQGIYRPDRSDTNPDCTGSREASFVLLYGVQVYGGFPPGGETWQQRDPNTHETILTGDLSGNDNPNTPPGELLDDPVRSDNTYHVVTFVASDGQTILDGFTVTGGNANGDTPQHQAGGGILGGYGRNPRTKATIRNCKIIANAAEAYGGGLYGVDGPISNCTVGHNLADYGGGFCFCFGQISNCTFFNNTADRRGGGLHECNGPIDNCAITHNAAPFGAGISSSDGTISDCNISENTASVGGGGLYGCNGSIKNCVINGNAGLGSSVGGGGAGYCSATISYCTISGNTTGAPGGGLYRCDKAISNCTISGNTAGRFGGGLYFCYGTISNCTIVGNMSGNRSGGLDRCLIVRECIIWDNRQGSDSWQYATASLIFCCVQGGSPGAGCIDADPEFVITGYWDDNGTRQDVKDDFWAEGDYHLKSQGWRWDVQRHRWFYDTRTSPCIDAGDPTVLLGDEPMTVPEDPNNIYGRNIRINMGAYGGTTKASIPPHGWAVRADYSNDGVVNLADFACWSHSRYRLLSPDLNGDKGRIADPDDLSIFTGDWLKQTIWSDGPLPMQPLLPPISFGEGGGGTAR